MIRTQIQIPDELYREAKRVAGEREWSLAELCRRGLEYMINVCPPLDRGKEEWSLPEPRALGGHDPFSDVDWRAGELYLHGKGRTEDRMPLPSDVGEAIAGYLKRGRPSLLSSSRSLFLTSRAPYRPLSAGRITATVAEAAARAGLR